MGKILSNSSGVIPKCVEQPLNSNLMFIPNGKHSNFITSILGCQSCKCCGDLLDIYSCFTDVLSQMLLERLLVHKQVWARAENSPGAKSRPGAIFSPFLLQGYLCGIN